MNKQDILKYCFIKKKLVKTIEQKKQFEIFQRIHQYSPFFLLFSIIHIEYGGCLQISGGMHQTTPPLDPTTTIVFINSS